MSAPRQGARELDPAAEEVWDRIRAEFVLQSGFWLGCLFGGAATDLDELVARSRDLAANRVQTIEVLTLAGPDDVAQVLRTLLTTAPPGVRGTWVIDRGGATPDRTRLWVELSRRLNERRDPVRIRRPGALIMAFPLGFLPIIRDEAPDLWSFRSLTATLEHTPVSTVVEGRRADELPGGANPLTPLFGEPIRPSATVGDLLRRAAASLRSDRIDLALAAASEALRTAEERDDAVLAYAWLAQAYAAADEPTEAARHAEVALRAGRPLEEATTVTLLEILSGNVRGATALEAAQALVAARRELVSRHGQSPTALRDLSVSLNYVAGVQARRGDLDAALTGYTEAVAVYVELREKFGPPFWDAEEATYLTARVEQLSKEISSGSSA
ncbi:MAG: hypothetical protein ACR2GH_11790 [Pseudonocardia sp.]